MKILLLLLGAVFYFVDGLATPNERVTGGIAAYSTLFPFTVSITDHGRHFCGGWIYSPSWIVTTASCIADKPAGSLSVVAGQISLTSADPAEQSIPVFYSYVFYGYNSTTKENDIALLNLITDIRFDDNDIVGDNLTFPLAVNNIRYNVEDQYFPATVIGWGATSQGGLESTYLRYADVTIVPDGLFCGDYGNAFVPSTMICAYGAIDTGSIAGSPCQYDEGGPLIQNYGWDSVVVGIVSTVGQCDPSSHSLYTRISPYYAWLVRTAGEQPTPLE